MKSLWVHISLFLVSLFYGILFSLAGNIMPTYIKPEAFVLIRVSVAFLAFSAMFFLFIKRQKMDLKKHGITLVICALFGTAGNMLLFFKGLAITKPINGAVLMMLTPIFVSIFEHIKYKIFPKFFTTVGILLGTIGSMFLIAGKGFSFNQTTIIGDVMVAINAIFYAIYLVTVKKLLVHYHSMHINVFTFGIGTLIVMPFGIMDLMHTNFAIFPTIIVIKMLYIVIFTTIIVYQLNAFAVKYASAQLVGTYIYLQPVMATIIAVIFGTDSLTIHKIFLGMLIISGVALVVWTDATKKR